jgi:hypothetical protein
LTTEIAKKQLVLRMKSGIEIWIDEDKADKVMSYLQTQKTGFGTIEGRLVNLVEIEGIFSPTDLEELAYRKQGMWKCKYNNWHNKNDDCTCVRPRDNYPDMEITQGSEKSKEYLDKLRKDLLVKNILLEKEDK